MKTPLVIVLVIVAGMLGFLTIYSQQPGETAQTTQGAAGGYGAPAPAAGGYGTPAAGGHGAPAAGGYGAPAAGGYGAPAPAAGGYGK